MADTPILQRVARNFDGSYTVVFGRPNGAEEAIVVPPGADEDALVATARARLRASGAVPDDEDRRGKRVHPRFRC